MALIEKVSQEDLILYEVLKHPVLCTEFINNIDKLDWEEEFILTNYQKEMLCDFNPYVSICTARATGKTVALVSIIIWLLINNIFPEEYIVYTVPNRVHLQPVWEGLVRAFRSNSFLKKFAEPKSGFNASEYRITLKNQARLFCRIAGQSGGASIVGLHTPFVLLDESGFYPWATWTELQPIVNSFTQGYRLLVAGVPTGLREGCVGYYCDQEDSNYSVHRVSAVDNPRFTEVDYERAKEQYGGEDNDDFIHLVLGLHGAPVFSLFDRRLFTIESNPVYKLKINGKDMLDEIDEYLKKIAILPPVPKNYGVLFGIDLGYTEPTAIFIMYLDHNERIKFHARIQLTKVSYNIQDRFIDLLDTKYGPFIIGVDEGSAGKAVIHRLQESEEFLHKEYKKKLIPINFSSQISLGIDSDGNEIKSKTKPFSVSVLQDYSNNGKIVYSSTDLDTISELERMTYSKNPSGDLSYKTLTVRGGKRGEDHFTSALLCGTLAYYLERESFQIKPTVKKLAKPRWAF